MLANVSNLPSYNMTIGAEAERRHTVTFRRFCPKVAGGLVRLSTEKNSSDAHRGRDSQTRAAVCPL